ncbi:MAG: TIM barrel protein, partial [Alphaproteobacteria bacterium]|nr:TIM barrel protein [Alphaproteobacteria bacterium]
MPKFAANLTVLFTELDFPDRFQAAAAAGFPAVECLFPYVRGKAELADWLAAAGLEQVLINMPAGDWAAGERGLTCLPGRREEYRDGISRAIDYATALDCPNIHSVAGLAPDGG